MCLLWCGEVVCSPDIVRGGMYSYNKYCIPNFTIERESLILVPISVGLKCEYIFTKY
jgi:hypothetical protein